MPMTPITASSENSHQDLLIDLLFSEFRFLNFEKIGFEYLVSGGATSKDV